MKLKPFFCFLVFAAILSGLAWGVQAVSTARAAVGMTVNSQIEDTPTVTETPEPTETDTPAITLTPSKTATIGLTSTPTTLSGDWPDLVITSMRIELETGGACNYPSTNLGVRVWFKNNGTVAAGPFVVEVNGAQQTFAAGLTAGQTGNLWFVGYHNGSPNSAWVDATDQVAESNESNNQLSQMVPVPTLPRPCTPTPSITPTPTVTRTITPISIKQTFTSIAAQDGWILESSEFSNTGGSMNALTTTFQLGDDTARRQFQAVLSFDTSALPNNAVIKSAQVKIMQSGKPVGKNPFNVFGSLWVDIRQGFFGNAAQLQLSDFNAAASAVKVGAFNKTPVGGWYTDSLNAAGLLKVNRHGLTQLRLHFATDDNNDHIADYMLFFSGNNATNKPQLVITYTLP